ncbi:MAG: AraC family transcriptional regulator [Mucilaginibacter polytrichastri]|nr:AraC family transcriptional regulator [Mucilaginibacter polytrichastri]
MVITREILPSPSLQAYVRCYAIRTFDTGTDILFKPFHALHEFFLTFWLLGEPLMILGENGKRRVYGTETQGIGLQTSSKGMMHFSGRNRLFSIQFRPNGFYRIFGVPGDEVTDRVFSAQDCLGSEFSAYHQRLMGMNDVAVIEETDRILLKRLATSPAKDGYDAITRISRLMYERPGEVNIVQLAAQANMSLRSFENHYHQQVGVLPKMYLRLWRFNRALEQKLYNPHRDWTNIAGENGYFDQNHLVKEFKSFAGDTPLHFFRNSAPPIENFLR